VHRSKCAIKVAPLVRSHLAVYGDISIECFRDFVINLVCFSDSRALLGIGIYNKLQRIPVHPHRIDILDLIPAQKLLQLTKDFLIIRRSLVTCLQLLQQIPIDSLCCDFGRASCVLLALLKQHRFCLIHKKPAAEICYNQCTYNHSN